MKKEKTIIIEKAKPVEETVAKKDGIYEITLKYNGIIDTFKTDNIADLVERIDYFKIKTNLVLTVKKDNKSCEKLLFLGQVKMLLRNKYTISVLIKKLIFK